jgi:hypothetical protein
MSVKNCSRDVLVSRNSSQMALDEYASKNTCKLEFCFFFYCKKYLFLLIYEHILLIYMDCELFIFKDKLMFEKVSTGDYAKFSYPLVYKFF